MADTVPLPTYRYDIRAGALQTGVEVLEEIGEFDATSTRATSWWARQLTATGSAPTTGSAPVALGG